MKKYFLFFVFLFSIVFFASCGKKNNFDKDACLYRILVGEKYGFINSQGDVVIEPQFDDAHLFFYNGYGIVYNDSKEFLINKKGDIVTEIDKAVYQIKPDRVNNDVIFIVKASNKETYKLEYYICDSLMRREGDCYDEIRGTFNNGLLAVKKNDKWGYIDYDGKIVIDTIFDDVRIFSEDGLARVVKDNKHFFIDKKGNCVISVDSTLTGFNKNRAAVIIDGEKCLIDKNGKVICKLNADEIEQFENDNLATIIKDGHASKIDKNGNIVLATNFKYIDVFYDGCSVACKSEINNLYSDLIGPIEEDVYGLIDSIGNVIIPFQFEAFESNPYGEDIFILREGVQATMSSFTKETYYYYDHKGNLIWKDMPRKKVNRPQWFPTRNDFIEYFDANISDLDPIEGIYYVTYKDYYQDRNNSNNIGLNNSNSNFYAIVRENQDGNEFWAYCIDGSSKCWVNKFVKLGETNNYAILKTRNDVNYSSEGKVTIENPNSFDFRLETGKNNWYNFFVTYDFARDYPPLEDLEQYQKTEWTGSGFAITNGYIATNYHVTNGAKTIRIKGVNGDIEKGYKGIVVASDKEHDLSVIKIIDKNFESFGKIPYSIGKSDVEVGDNIFVLGYPLVTSMGNEIKLTEGIISSSTGYKGNQSMLQISAAVQPGNSGGPLFNEEGDVVGVVCAKHKNAENANYAVKISYLNNMLKTSGYKIELNEKNRIHKKELSAKVKEIKDYVYLIECSSK